MLKRWLRAEELKYLKGDSTKIREILHVTKNKYGMIYSASSGGCNGFNFELDLLTEDLHKNGKNFPPKSLYFQLDLAFKGITDLVMLKKKVFLVQLEKLHWEHKKVMYDFCKIFKIKYDVRVISAHRTPKRLEKFIKEEAIV